MEINLESLKNLCFTHSVSGDTVEIIAYLSQQLEKMKIDYEITPFGVLVFGNRTNPKVMVSAHADEVGFEVVKKNTDGTFLVKKSGHVDATMLNNSSVYVMTKKGMVKGTFYPTKELGNNKPENFTEIFLDTVDNDAVEIGNFGSYERQFYATDKKVIACALDNKISVAMVLEMVEENPNLLQDTLFSFVTEEETTYDCIAGISNLYKPEYALILDMLPVNQVDAKKVEVLPELGKGPAVLFAFGSYSLHPILREKLKQVTLPYQKAYLDIEFPPEPQIVQENGVTKGMNIFVPLYGWHSSTSTLMIQDFAMMKDFVKEMHAILVK